jgi:DNA-binding response OmpR family regulator
MSPENALLAMNVLLVEDGLGVAQSIIIGLREQGYEASLVTDGADGFRLAREGPWQDAACGGQQ